MPTQYTIRDVPNQLDAALRKRKELTGRSLNSIVIEDLETLYGISVGKKDSLADSLDWFIGSKSLDDKTLKTLEDMRGEQKRLALRELDT